MDRKTEKDTPAEVDEEALDQTAGGGSHGSGISAGKVAFQDPYIAGLGGELRTRDPAGDAGPHVAPEEKI